MVVMGVDPGVSPAVVVVGPRQDVLVAVRTLRFAFKDTLGRNRNEPSIPALSDLLRQFNPELVVVEQVASRPAQGVASSARFLYATGLIVGCVRGLGFHVLRPTPQTWQKAMRVRDGKDGSRARCMELLPGLASQLQVKASHDLADAGLMALYGQQVGPYRTPAPTIPEVSAVTGPAW